MLTNRCGKAQCALKSERSSFLRLAAEAHLLRKTRTGSSVVGGDHRIVRVEIPLFAVLFRRHVVMGHEVTLQRLELLAVFEADDVVVMNRLLRVDGRLRLLNDDRRFFAFDVTLERGMYFGDQQRQLASANRIIADICSYNICSKAQKQFCALVVRVQIFHQISFFTSYCCAIDDWRSPPAIAVTYSNSAPSIPDCEYQLIMSFAIELSNHITLITSLSS